ncbi:TonB-dependent receptor domain-containing protein [Ottowia thiooxydans]|uniref:TonB-dependent receptor domain-containing protein n=1 Tax=Ottowia thiooxydans TaxID=219182 RepID=UPI0003FCE9C6|nr:TonB-dependent receptor [Ottowia thiooxydans]
MNKPPFPHHKLTLAIALAVLPPAAFAQDAVATPEAATPTLNTVRITGTALDIPLEESSTPVELLDERALLQRRSGTLGETLDGLPGVRNNNYGAGAGRPVIRGADGARVRILSDGSEVQDASTSSPDHAVGLEPMLASEIEVLRGPSTLIYGGGIVGGVVNVRDKRIPTAVPAKGYTGSVEVRSESSAREKTGLFSLTTGSGPIALHVEGLNRSAGDYETGSGWTAPRVAGSATKTWYGSVGGSYIHSNGYLGIAYSRLRSKYGLPGHSHEYEDCHPHGSSLHCGSDHGHSPDQGPTPSGCHWHGSELHCTGSEGESNEVALVDMDTERWDIRGEWRDPLPGFARVRLRASLTDYRHDEIDHGEIGTTFKNKAHDARLELEHNPLTLGPGTLRGLLGAQQSRRKFSAVGEEAFVEPTVTQNYAVFGLEEYRLGDWRFELSGRYEWQDAQLNGTTRRGTVKHHMGSISGGASWNFTPGHTLAVSLSRSQRAPTAEELFAGGVHLATNTWERGNARLKAEQSTNLDISLRKTSGDTRYELTAFHNRIGNYIYADTTDRYENFRLVDYRQRDASFTGLEARASHQLNRQWRVGISGDLVRASFSSGGNVPRIPSYRFGMNVEWRSGPWSASAEWYRNFAQNRLASFETRTPAYDMVNLRMAWRGQLSSGQGYELYASLNNALDKLAFNHTSFVKDASPLRGRSLMVGARFNF